jgi:protein-S-isoprenylcysteine O-methyltransferase Ste14
MSYPLAAALYLLCLGIRSAYELLKEARKINPESTLIFALILTVMCALWILWFSLCPMDPFRFALPGLLRWSGFTLFLGGMVLAVGALIKLRGVENVKHLVTTGLFKKIRHPMYLGFILWILGWSIFHGALVSLAVGSPGVASALWWRHLEESRLKKQFGDEYDQYRRTTWF